MFQGDASHTMNVVAPRFWLSAGRAALVASVVGTTAACSGDVARFGEIGEGPLYTGSISPVASIPSGSNAPSQNTSGPSMTAAPAAQVETAAIPALAPADTPRSNVPTVTTNYGRWSAGSASIVVQPGDTLYGIATRYGVPSDVLMEVNGISSANAVQAGQTLLLPVFSAGAAASAATPAGAPSQSVQPSGTGSAAQGRYTVAAGDTLYGIARRHDISASALASANSLDANASVRIGQTLVIPGQRSAEETEPAQAASPAPQLVAPVIRAVAVPSQPAAPDAAPAVESTMAAPAPATVQPAGYTPPATSATTTEETPTVQKAALPSEVGDTGQFRWPVRGRIISRFGRGVNGADNAGINLAVPVGTAVQAAEAGIVAYAGDELKGYGNLVLIRHSNDYVTAYAHNSELLVKRGDQVMRGQVIAKAGQTGTVTSPQLHFEVRKGSRPVDPMQYLAAR